MAGAGREKAAGEEQSPRKGDDLERAAGSVSGRAEGRKEERTYREQGLRRRALRGL